jgi:hypothetical protein
MATKGLYPQPRPVTPPNDQKQTPSQHPSFPAGIPGDKEDDNFEGHTTPESHDKTVNTATPDEAIVPKFMDLPFEIQDEIWNIVLLQSSSQIVEIDFQWRHQRFDTGYGLRGTGSAKCLILGASSDRRWGLFTNKAEIRTIAAQTCSRSRYWTLRRFKPMFTSLPLEKTFSAIFFDPQEDFLYLRSGHEKFRENVSLEDRANVKQLICTPHKFLAERVHMTFPKLERILFVLEDKGYSTMGDKINSRGAVVSIVILDKDHLQPNHTQALGISGIFESEPTVAMLEAEYKELWKPLPSPEFAFLKIVRDGGNEYK